MTERTNEPHLSPELFVDVLEKSPVDASVRRHLDACAACAAELHELQETLGVLKDERAAPSARPFRPAYAWAAAAALVILAFSLLFRGTPAYAPATPDLLLPPLESDESFQLLVAMSEALGETGTAEALSEAGVSSSFELTELSEEERARLVERLTEEVLQMETSS